MLLFFGEAEDILNKEQPEAPQLSQAIGSEGYPQSVYQSAVNGLIAITILGIIGIIALAFSPKAQNSEGLIAITSAAVGGLVGIFSQKGNRQ